MLESPDWFMLRRPALQPYFPQYERVVPPFSSELEMPVFPPWWRRNRSLTGAALVAIDYHTRADLARALHYREPYPSRQCRVFKLREAREFDGNFGVARFDRGRTLSHPYAEPSLGVLNNEMCDGRAEIETIIRDLKHSLALGKVPSGAFNANHAMFLLKILAHNPLRRYALHLAPRCSH